MNLSAVNCAIASSVLANRLARGSGNRHRKNRRKEERDLQEDAAQSLGHVCEATCQSGCQTACQSSGQHGDDNADPGDEGPSRPAPSGTRGDSVVAATRHWADRCRITQLLLFTAAGEDACSMRCSYCFLPKRGGTEVMSVETLHRAIDFLAEVATGEPSLLFFGAEPTMQWQLIEEARRHTDMPFSMTTNGYLLTRKRIDWCNANGVRVHVYSIDGGPEHNRHRLDRRGRQTWGVVARHFRYLAESQGAWLTARVTWTPDDYDLAGRFRALEALGAQSIQVVPNVEGGVVWDEARVERAYLELGEFYKWHGTPSRYINDMVAAIRNQAPKPGDSCNSGRGYWAVMPDGTLRTCQRGKVIGDVWRGITDPRPLIESALVAVILNSRMRLKPECSHCIAFSRCPGPGFCAAANREAHGNPAVPTEGHCAHLRGMVRACTWWAEKQKECSVGRVLMRNALGVTYGEAAQERTHGSAAD